MSNCRARNASATGSTVVLLLAVGIGTGCRGAFPHELVEGAPMYEVMPRDGIAAIDDPEFVSAAKADEFLEPEEPVIGVVGRNGSAKAYSVWQLEGHEIVNDVLDDEPITATW